MSEKEKERLEREREKQERARERLEMEREKLERARERLEEERVRLEEESERLGEEVAEKVTRAVSKIDIKADAIDKAMEHIQDQIENGIAGIEVDIEGGNRDDVLKNLGVLNMKDITDEELDKIKGIRNLGMMIVPEELMSKVSAKVTKNLGTIVPYKKGWRLYSGHTKINAAMLEALDEPLEFLQTGHLEFEDDVTPELVKDKIKAFHNYGHVQATEATYGVLMAKCLENYGMVSKGKEDEDED
jgi:hypothetical protein